MRLVREVRSTIATKLAGERAAQLLRELHAYDDGRGGSANEVEEALFASSQRGNGAVGEEWKGSVERLTALQDGLMAVEQGSITTTVLQTRTSTSRLGLAHFWVLDGKVLAARDRQRLRCTHRSQHHNYAGGRTKQDRSALQRGTTRPVTL